MSALAVRLGVLVIAAVATLLTVALAAALVAMAVAAFAVTGLAIPLLLAGAAVMLQRRPLGRARLGALAGGGDRHPDQLLDVARNGSSSCEHSEMAMPSAPARAVRPMRWT